MGGDQSCFVVVAVLLAKKDDQWQDSEVTWLLRLALRKQDGLSGFVWKISFFEAWQTALAVLVLNPELLTARSGIA